MGSSLPRGVFQSVAMPTAPRVPKRRIELPDRSPAVTLKIGPLSAVVPWQVSDVEDLIIQLDGVLVAVLWPNAGPEELNSVNPPICRRRAGVARSA